MRQRYSFWISLLIFGLSIHSNATKSSKLTIIKAEKLLNSLVTEFTAEHAITPQQLFWGLMQKKHLAENHGMTFNFSRSASRHFWMINCFIDLSVAYCDKDKIITEIHKMLAFPRKMDPDKPILSMNDWWKYPPSQEVQDYFLENGAPSNYPLHYALEMRYAWFEDKDIQVGDLCNWSIHSNQGYITKTIALDLLIKKYPLPIKLVFPNTREYSFNLDYDSSIQVELLNDSDQVLKKSQINPYQNFITPIPIRSLMITKLLD